ncbi:MAG: response regulator [Magnetococcales bacterium]|nr:response regulator [Magnetococcales bacterium]
MIHSDLLNSAPFSGQETDILIADDSAATRLLLEYMVKKWGYRVFSARDGVQALEILSAPNPPRLALLDWMMPNLDGLGVIKKVAEDPNIPFIYSILITNRSEPEDMITALNAGADDFLAKPIQVEELNSRIKVGQRTIGYQLRQEESMQLMAVQKQDLKQAKEKAELADLAKTRFLRWVSHDLSQPLSSMGMFIEQMGAVRDLSEMRNQMRGISSSYQTLSELLNSLLTLDHVERKFVEHGAVEPQISSIDLGVLFNRLALEYVPLAQLQGIKLRVVPTRAVVQSDAGFLERIIRNLVTNAVRYTRQGGGVLLGCRARGDAFRIEVWDTGEGIPAEKQQKIFREFDRLDSNTSAHKHASTATLDSGLGLGLAIVKSLVQILHYPLELRSEPGRGSRFSITVPVGDPDNIKPVWSLDLQNTGAIPKDSLIVVVDDDQDVRTNVLSLLDKWSCQGVGVESRSEAFAKFDQLGRQPDFIISDYHLLNDEIGTDVIKAILAHFNAEIPALIITSHTAPDFLKKLQKSGFDYLTKPVSPAKLRSYLKSKLSQQVRFSA